jgi:hypothetical protein
MNRNHRFASILAVGALTVTAAFAQLAGTDDFEIPWNTMDAGGITFANGSSFELGGTIGQPDATLQVLTGGTFALTGGFWTGVDPDIVPTCPADIAPPGGDDVVDVDDLLVVINNWGACPGCVADIAPAGGDDVVDVDDLLVIINSWGPCD